MDITAVLSGLIEKVRKEGALPKMLNRAPDLVLGLIGEKNVQVDVNQRFYRIPFKTLPSGNFGKLNANGGTFGQGNGIALSHFTCGYFYYSQAHKINLEVMETARGAGSVVDVMSELLSDANDMMQQHHEVLLHTSGNGVLTNSSSVYSTSVYTFAGVSDFLGVNRLLEGMTVSVWDTTLSTFKGDRRILRIDHNAKTVTLSSAPTDTPQAGDRLAIRSLPVYGPATPTTFASGYPGSSANGVTGDSFVHGLDYYLNTTSSNYVLGVQKSTIPQINPRHIPAGGASLTYLHPIRLVHKMLRNRGQKGEDIQALVPLSQVEQLMQINMALQTIQTNGDSFGKIKNLAPDSPDLAQDVPFGGIKGKIDIRQAENTVQVIRPSLWGKVEPVKVDFYKVGGDYIRATRDGNGEITAGAEFFLHGALDYFCLDPGAQGVVDGLAVPTGSF